jgi:hypothetical protein
MPVEKLFFARFPPDGNFSLFFEPRCAGLSQAQLLDIGDGIAKAVCPWLRELFCNEPEEAHITLEVSLDRSEKGRRRTRDS